MSFTLGVVQFQPAKAEISNNLDRMATAILQAVESGADVVVFPETAVSGYILEGGVYEVAMAPEALFGELESRLGGLTKAVDVSAGFYESNQSRPFNSAAYMVFGPGSKGLRHVYRKFFLPTYGVFDEARFHQNGNQLGIVDTRFGRFGMLICEDVWHSILGSLLCAAGATTLLVHSASPARGFREEKPANVLRYERMLSALSEEHGVTTAMAMLVGFEGGKGLAGGSLVISPFGETIAQADVLGEQIVLAEIDESWTPRARSQSPLAEDLTERWADIVRLAQGIER